MARQYLALARGVVVPNREGIVPGTQGYVYEQLLSPGGTTVEKTNKFSVKIDHTLSDRHRLSYLFNRTTNRVKPGDAGPAGLPLPFNTFQTTSFDGDLHRASWDWIGQRMVNHFSFGVNTFDKDAFSPNVGQNWQDRVCIPNAVDCNDNLGNITFTEFSQWGGPSNNGTEQPRLAVKDDFTLQPWLAHSSRPASPTIASRRTASASRTSADAPGFSFRGTSVPAAATLAAGGGSSFASFLLGVADSGRTETIRYLQQVYSYYSFYAQDDWRLNDKLVLNYGVRYEFTEPPVAGGDQYSDFSPTMPNPAVNDYPGALIFAGEGAGRTGTRSLVPGYYGAWGPRVSFAYSANDRTTIRGGVGRSFGRVTVTQSSSHFAGFIGQYVFSTPDSGITPAFHLDQGLPAYPLPPRLDPTFSNNNDVDWFNGQEASTPGGLRQLDAVDAARAAAGAHGGSRLQRRLRLASAGQPDQPQPGADVGRERPRRTLRSDRRPRSAQRATSRRPRRSTPASRRRIRTSPTPSCRPRARSRRHCGLIRSTRSSTCRAAAATRSARRTTTPASSR